MYFDELDEINFICYSDNRRINYSEILESPIAVDECEKMYGLFIAHSGTYIFIITIIKNCLPTEFNPSTTFYPLPGAPISQSIYISKSRDNKNNR